MTRMPGTVWLGEHAPVQASGERLRMDHYDIVCVHTIVGFAPAHAAHFSVKSNGTILQSRDTDFRSGANLNGNHRVIAVENEDHGADFPHWEGSNVPALTDAQVEANAAILAWAHQTHGIPLQLCPDSRPTSRGLAYHRQGIDGNFGDFAFPGRVDGGEVWTTSFGKVCPGDRRIAQLPTILRIAQGEDMPLTENEWDRLGKLIDGRLEAFGRSAGDLIKLDHDGNDDTAKLSLERVLRGRVNVQLDSAQLKVAIEAALREVLPDSVVHVDVSVGTKSS